MSQREALALSHLLFKTRMNRVKQLKQKFLLQGKDKASADHHKKKRKLTAEEKLEKLQKQESELKARLERLNQEKHAAFKTFRELLAKEEAQKREREAKKRAAEAAQGGPSKEQDNDYPHKSSILSDMKVSHRPVPESAPVSPAAYSPLQQPSGFFPGHPGPRPIPPTQYGASGPGPAHRVLPAPPPMSRTGAPPDPGSSPLSQPGSSPGYHPPIGRGSSHGPPQRMPGQARGGAGAGGPPQGQFGSLRGRAQGGPGMPSRGSDAPGFGGQFRPGHHRPPYPRGPSYGYSQGYGMRPPPRGGPRPGGARMPPFDPSRYGSNQQGGMPLHQRQHPRGSGGPVNRNMPPPSYRK